MVRRRTTELDEERDLDGVLTLLDAQKLRAVQPTQLARCPTCGTGLLALGELANAACTQCGVRIEAAGLQTEVDLLPVDGVLPFGVPIETAWDALQAWSTSLWFVPNGFAPARQIQDLRAVYLPHWCFELSAVCSYKGERGDSYRNSNDEQSTSWKDASGTFESHIENLLVPALSALPADVLARLEPWPFDQIRPVRPGDLDGMQAHTYDVELDAGFTAADAWLREAFKEEAEDEIGGDEQRIDTLDVVYRSLSYEQVLLPVYIASTHWNGTLYRTVVNACTGEVHGEHPRSGLRVLLLVALFVGAAVGGAFLAHLTEPR
jgi:hypothetical protein